MLATKDQMNALLEVFKTGDELVYKKGEFIIRPGQKPTGVFYIKSGLVKAYDISKYGEENLLIIRKEKEIFPLIWAVTGQERHIIYEALSPTVLLHVERKKFFETLQNKPDTMVPVLDMVTEMYRIHSERILNLEYRTVRERLISFLLTMANRFGEEKEDGVIVIEVPLKHQDIASSINATRETTSREMNYLENHGLVKNKSSIIQLLDTDKLTSYL
jgi:CRP/FNR family cyclic AMP-dependent transcriptional regulator